jgi:predicted deacetylase
MYKALVILIALSAFNKAGINPSDFFCTNEPTCAARLTEGRKRLLKVNWKPLVVFPKEAAKFQAGTP